MNEELRIVLITRRPWTEHTYLTTKRIRGGSYDTAISDRISQASYKSTLPSSLSLSLAPVWPVTEDP